MMRFIQGLTPETKSIFSVVRERDSVFDRKILPYDGNDGLN